MCHYARQKGVKKMTQPIGARIAEHFKQVQNPRQHDVDHLLLEIITIAMCAVICGADSWVEIAEFGEAKEEWFRNF